MHGNPRSASRPARQLGRVVAPATLLGRLYIPKRQLLELRAQPTIGAMAYLVYGVLVGIVLCVVLSVLLANRIGTHIEGLIR